MQQKFPAFTDLMAVADALENEPSKRRIADLIRRAGRAQSCRADLTLAQHCCEAIAQFSSPSLAVTPTHMGAARHALLMNAILHYARATSTGQKMGERGSISIVDRLPDELKPTHRHVTELRDRAYAHVHTNELIGDRMWHRESVFAVRDDDGWQPAAITIRIQEDATALNDLRRLLPVANALLTASFHRRINELTAALNEVPDLLPVFEACQFDPVAMSGSPEAVRDILGAKHKGTGFGFTSAAG